MSRPRGPTYSDDAYCWYCGSTVSSSSTPISLVTSEGGVPLTIALTPYAIDTVASAIDAYATSMHTVKLDVLLVFHC